RHPVFVPVKVGERRGNVALRRLPAPGVVAIGRLDLDHPRAAFGEQQRCVRTGDSLSHVDDCHAVEDAALDRALRAVKLAVLDRPATPAVLEDLLRVGSGQQPGSGLRRSLGELDWNVAERQLWY